MIRNANEKQKSLTCLVVGEVPGDNRRRHRPTKGVFVGSGGRKSRLLIALVTSRLAHCRQHNQRNQTRLTNRKPQFTVHWDPTTVIYVTKLWKVFLVNLNFLLPKDKQKVKK